MLSFLLCVIKDTSTCWSKVLVLSQEYLIPRLIDDSVVSHLQEKTKTTLQPNLSGMLLPWLICLVNSYSSFETQIKYHLLRKAFHAHPAPQAWCFPTLCCPSPWGSSVSGLAHCLIIIPKLLKCREGGEGCGPSWGGISPSVARYYQVWTTWGT